jgi:hypothetical protein
MLAAGKNRARLTALSRMDFVLLLWDELMDYEDMLMNIAKLPEVWPAMWASGWFNSNTISVIFKGLTHPPVPFRRKYPLKHLKSRVSRPI